MTGWVGYGWSEPIAYAYGDNVYYQDDSVYYGDQAVASAEEYAAAGGDDRRQPLRRSLPTRPNGCRWACSP